MFKRHLSSIVRRKREHFLVAEQLENRWLLAGDLAAHWLADNIAAELEHGSVVPTWTDSVAGLEVTASGSPTLSSNQLGGRAVVSFESNDGAGTFFLDSRLNPLTDASDFTVVVVLHRCGRYCRRQFSVVPKHRYRRREPNGIRTRLGP